MAASPHHQNRPPPRHVRPYRSGCWFHFLLFGSDPRINSSPPHNVPEFHRREMLPWLLPHSKHHFPVFLLSGTSGSDLLPPESAASSRYTLSHCSNIAGSDLTHCRYRHCPSRNHPRKSAASAAACHYLSWYRYDKQIPGRPLLPPDIPVDDPYPDLLPSYPQPSVRPVCFLRSPPSDTNGFQKVLCLPVDCLFLLLHCR